MNLRSIVAALPWLRSLWRWLPGPLRIPLLAVAAVVWLWRRFHGDDPDDEASTGATDGAPPA